MIAPHSKMSGIYSPDLRWYEIQCEELINNNCLCGEQNLPCFNILKAGHTMLGVQFTIIHIWIAKTILSLGVRLKVYFLAVSKNITTRSFHPKKTKHNTDSVFVIIIVYQLSRNSVNIHIDTKKNITVFKPVSSE